jgi:hypothetical protein
MLTALRDLSSRAIAAELAKRAIPARWRTPGSLWSREKCPSSIRPRIVIEGYILRRDLTSAEISLRTGETERGTSMRRQALSFSQAAACLRRSIDDVL